MQTYFCSYHFSLNLSTLTKNSNHSLHFTWTICIHLPPLHTSSLTHLPTLHVLFAYTLHLLHTSLPHTFPSYIHLHRSHTSLPYKSPSLTHLLPYLTRRPRLHLPPLHVSLSYTSPFLTRLFLLQTFLTYKLHISLSYTSPSHTHLPPLHCVSEPTFP